MGSQGEFELIRGQIMRYFLLILAFPVLASQPTAEMKQQVLKSMKTQRAKKALTERPYLKPGLSIMIPKAKAFSGKTQTGVGIHMGIGKYFGRVNAIEANLSLDTQLAASVIYRFEWKVRGLIVGPVLGVRQKLASLSLIEVSDETKSTYAIFGMQSTIPMENFALAAQMTLLWNDHSILAGTLGLHYFL